MKLSQVCFGIAWSRALVNAICCSCLLTFMIFGVPSPRYVVGKGWLASVSRMLSPSHSPSIGAYEWRVTWKPVWWQSNVSRNIHKSQVRLLERLQLTRRWRIHGQLQAKLFSETPSCDTDQGFLWFLKGWKSRFQAAAKLG
jgi:hypothetical protein